jgi:hypothetical protein
MEQEQRVDSLASEAYGRGRLRRDSIGEWYWFQETGGRVSLGWSLTGAEHRLQAAIHTGNGRSEPSRGKKRRGRTRRRPSGLGT